MKKDKHKYHVKKRLYARTSTKWKSTDLYLCDCGAVLERTDVEVEKYG